MLIITLRRDIAFRHFIEFPSGVRRFTLFLKQEFSQVRSHCAVLLCDRTLIPCALQENIDFFFAVQQFRATEADLQARVETIMTYVTVCVPSQLLNSVHLHGVPAECVCRVNSQFIGEESASQVNINGVTKKALEKQVKDGYCVQF
jgi:hypothetical protein